MNQENLFSSKKFFIFNLVLVGIILGFSLSLITFSCSTQLSSGDSVQAQDTFKEMPPTATLEEMQNSFRYVAQEVLPVVVELQVVEMVSRRSPHTDRGWPWNFLFPDDDYDEQNEQEFRSEGLGSGVIVDRIDNTYYILTNNHVIGEAEEISVILHDNRRYTGELVGRDDRRDLAMVKFESGDQNINIARLGDSDDLYVGDWVLAVGSPFGYVSSVTAGIVSALGRTGPRDNISDFIQTDAAINRGNSGGALANIKGEVIGINTWIAAPMGGNVGLGFSIPINNAKRAIVDFIATGEVQYGWLGVTVHDIIPEVAKDMNIADKNGAFISNVYFDSPAYKGGMRPGDFVRNIDGRPVRNSDELVRMVGDLLADQKSKFIVTRQGEEKELSITIGKRADSETIASRYADLWPGISVMPLTDGIRDELSIDKTITGILIANAENRTKFYAAGLRAGDVLISINDSKIHSVVDFYEIINDPEKKDYQVLYQRQKEKYKAHVSR